MKSKIQDAQRGALTRMGVSQIWRVIGLTVCFVFTSAGFALAVTGNLEPPPGEATNLLTGEPAATTPTQPSWANRLDGLVGQAHRWKLVMGGEAVLDRETGLVWEQSPKTTRVLRRDIPLGCLNRIVGGRRGWRLPSVHELTSLVDPPNRYPALPVAHPFSNVQSTFYWTATMAANVSEDSSFRQWVVDFANGIVGRHWEDFPGVAVDDRWFQGIFQWCVRGGGPISEH